MKISEVKVGERHRKTLGDLSGLARSMEEVGLLHPIVVLPDGTLVAGERRLRAAEQLGWTTIDARKIDLDDPLRAERDENEQRKGLTKSEAVAVARAILERERVAAAGRIGGRPPKTSADSAEVSENGDSRDKAAVAVGMGRTALAQATAVVEAAEDDPETFGDLVEKMDETGKVDPAYRELEARRQPPETPEERHARLISKLPCPCCGRPTPQWVVAGVGAPEGETWRWLK